MIIADTNLVAYLVINGASTATAERARSRDHDWLAPALLRSELLNVIAQNVRLGRLSRDQAIRAYRRGLSVVEFFDGAPDPVAVLNLCATAGCSTYDAEFVWLAQERATKLVTADQQLLAAAGGTAISIADFAAGR